MNTQLGRAFLIVMAVFVVSMTWFPAFDKQTVIFLYFSAVIFLLVAVFWPDDFSD